jgi:chemotaxis protein methyltransferase CheR
MPLSSEELAYVREFVRAESAIVLEDRDYLIESRLGLLADREGFAHAGQLVQTARNPSHAPAMGQKIVDALTTNETQFFRDVHPFNSLRDLIIPELSRRNAASQRIRIWCAACSTGQEPYSLAMLLRAHFPELDNWRVEILATDLSTAVLERASAGVYNQTEINRGLPAAMLVRFFEQRESDWRIDPSIRNMVKFSRRNLIEPWPEEREFDIVFIRNVMIYFELETRRVILGRIAARLAPSGILLLGATETTIGLSEDFALLPVGKTALFRKK